ncbi:MAG: PKD domain-containing protein [Saprospiraceae bacterium]
MKHLCFVLCLIFFCTLSVQARHIIGGVMTYRCLGDTPDVPGSQRYFIVMKVYRDNTGGTGFDGTAFIAVYQGDSDIPFLTPNQPFGGEETTLDPELGPCLEVPPNVDVREAIYSFFIDLPVSTESYHIVYQRCCRNVTISNIVDPQDTGATFSVEITPEGQNFCNATPTFDNFPPIVVCANQALVFDHAATDIDGDQLVYELCAPLKGGGPDGGTANPTGSSTGCNGIRPNPPCAPPFDEVEFIVTEFSALDPMGGMPPLNIDPNTGLLTGTPTTLGQFVVGVCVSEFRNGQLIGQIRRDFQFNVANCDPVVAAEVEYDELIGDQQYLINSCGEREVTIINRSTQQQNIFDQFWIFDIDGQLDTFDTWDLTLTFPDFQEYSGWLYLNPGETCADSAQIFVNIYPEPTTDFSFTYDSCVAGPVEFNDTSFSAGGPITAWDWIMADQGVATGEDPSFLFTDPGSHEVILMVTDTNNCTAQAIDTVNWFPAPPIIIVDPSTFQGCIPLDISFVNLSTPIDTSYQTLWDFGNGDNSSVLNPNYTYWESGIYDISLSITSPIGCQIDTVFNNWIEVFESPVADFTYSPLLPNNFEPTVDFLDQSIDAVGWNWDFNGYTISSLQNPSFTFPDTGLQIVQLIATNENFCSDTTYQIIDVAPHIRYFLPNAFTPNDDSLNEFFKAAGYFRGINNYRMMIWNRWGELIYEGQDPDSGWNGRKNNVGKLAPNGVYIYKVKFNGPRGKPYEFQGFATLVK